MKTVTFQLVGESYNYIGQVVWRDDTYAELEESLFEVEITDEQFEQVTLYGCAISYDGETVTVTPNEAWNTRYISLRRANYPDLMDYIDAKIKQASLDGEVAAEGVAEETAYLDACLAVNALYPAPE